MSNAIPDIKMLSGEEAAAEFKRIIEWMKAISDDKMKTEEGRQWLRDNWCIRVA